MIVQDCSYKKSVNCSQLVFRFWAKMSLSSYEIVLIKKSVPNQAPFFWCGYMPKYFHCLSQNQFFFYESLHWTLSGKQWFHFLLKMFEIIESWAKVSFLGSNVSKLGWRRTVQFDHEKSCFTTIKCSRNTIFWFKELSKNITLRFAC